METPVIMEAPQVNEAEGNGRHGAAVVRGVNVLLELQQLSVSFGDFKAVDGIDLSIDSKALGLLGPNGAGKSTLIRALLGLVPAEGAARIEGHDIRNEGRAIRGLIGYMPEHEAWLGGMTVVRFLRLMGEMCGLPSRAAMERAHEVLFYVGLGEVRYRKLDGLSYGMHQKVRLAQALVHGPRVLILDEPTSGLDPAAREEMLGLINDMVARSQGKVIISSHILRDIEVCCKEVVVMKRGRVIAAGNIDQMRQTDENMLELRVKGDMERFIAALAGAGCECRLNERDTIQVTTPKGMQTSAIYEIAKKMELQIRHLYARRDSLEDIFIKVMEDEPEGANANK